ncbi:MAG: hypothetical protein NTX45_03590 [Proteobacteria bacterium]|nr:hypothetical protein [Pseudomonadota bacterium]
MKDNNCCIAYRINERDEIVAVNDDWCRYASDHGWEGISPGNVMHRPIYNYIPDSTTSRIYQYLFKRVRGGSSVRYKFNCESDSHRREMEMTVMAYGNGGEVEMKARMLSKQAKMLARSNSASNPDADEFIRACGWCCRIDMEGYWMEVEEAVAKWGVFEFSRLPKLTHGICKDCFTDMIKDADSSLILTPSTS